MIKRIYFKSGITLVVSLLFFIRTANAQPNQPFPESDAVWTIGVYTVFGDFLYSYRYSFPGSNIDTAINSRIYKKIMLVNNSDSAYYKGAIRQDTSRRVFFMPKDSLSEKLLYDFSAEIDDTVYDVYSDWTSSEPVHDEEILDVDHVLIGGALHKRLYLKLNLKWIEGIGCNGGLFESTYGGTFSYVFRLDCFYKNGVLLYSSTTSNCVPGIKNENLKDELCLYPNPGTGIFKIKNNSFNYHNCILTIRDLLGKCVFKESLIEEKESIDLTHLNDGVYFYTVELNNRKTSGKLIIEK
jgi:hypothetical protein